MGARLSHRPLAQRPPTRLRVAAEAPDDSPRVLLTPGRRHGTTRAGALVEGPPAGRLIAGTAHDADGFRHAPGKAGAVPAIPSDPARACPVRHDRDLHEERRVVMCFF